MAKNVLITGGSGLVGSRLTTLLLEHGYEVSHLGRSKSSEKRVKSYIWDIQKGFIEEGAIETANFIVHLAGASVADERWTESRKKVILQSRIQTTRLLYEQLQVVKHSCEAVVSASAVGYYGMDTGSQWLNEQSPAGSDFLADVTKQWEQEVEKLEKLNIRVTRLRIGIVLSKNGGALPKIAQTVKANIGAPLGDGDQYMSWIHIDDLCRMIIHAIGNTEMFGVFNAVGPDPATNRELTKTLAQVLNKSLWLPAVPGFALKLALGEMADMVLGGNRVSAEKIQLSGFTYAFSNLQNALEDIYQKD